jgi:hypothetical protein
VYWRTLDGRLSRAERLRPGLTDHLSQVPAIAVLLLDFDSPMAHLLARNAGGAHVFTAGRG